MSTKHTGDIDEQELRALLSEACAANGGQVAWALAHGLSSSYVNRALNGRDRIGSAIATALGFERVVIYRRLPDKAA